MPTNLIRYWGSHFKSARHVDVFAREFSPLVSRSWRCALVIERLPEDPSWMLPLQKLGIHIECAPRPRSGIDWRVVRCAKELCRRQRAHILICDNMHTSPLLGAALARVPVRGWFKRSMSSHYQEMRLPTWRERLCLGERLSCMLSTRIFAVSHAVKNEIVNLGFPGGKIVVRHNPRRLADLGRAMERRVARRQWGFEDADVVIGTVGHAVPVKGWDILIRAFARVAQKDVRARLLMVGSYQSAAEQACCRAIHEFLDAEQLTDKVRFTGHLGDVASALRAMDVFALPSRSEGCANALIEAMQAGLPCVATRVGSATDVVQDGAAGFLVDRGDVNGLAEALLKLFADGALRAQFAQSASVPPGVPTLEEYAEHLARDYEGLLAEVCPGTANDGGGIPSEPKAGERGTRGQERIVGH